MIIVFRTDAATELGHGHVVRCLALAKALNRAGAVVHFVCREHEGHLCDLVAEEGFRVTRLPSGSAQSADTTSSRFATRDAAASREDDARLTREAIRQLGEFVDWLVVDHYGLDAEWETKMRPLTRRIMVIDDLADRTHDCDLLLDQNLLDKPETRYAGKLPAGCTALFGPEYALLQPEYAQLHASAIPRNGPIRRVLIFFGGTDVDNLTGLAISAFDAHRHRGIAIEVVTTSGNPHTAVLRQQLQHRADIKIHVDLPTLGHLMAQADLAVGAGGTTSWERLCVGLPALVITVAENQRAVAAELHRRELVRWLGHKDQVSGPVLSDALREVLREGLNPSWSERCMRTVDGKGAERVCAMLLTSQATALRARAAGKNDEALLLQWANDPVTRRNSLNPELIQVEAHRKWLEERLQRPDECRFYIIETPEHIPIGQVRFQRESEGWELHYAVAPVFRGRGLGRAALAIALMRLRADAQGACIFGRVKSENIPSQRIFQSLGFVLEAPARAETIVYRLRF